MNVFQKENITILITDSGIGGLSVASLLYNKMKSYNSYKKVNIVYCDARKNKKNGYNAIEDSNQKIKLFSDRLTKMYKKINPDIIFIACNTLSILYNKTDFFKKYSVPVIDIFSTGCNSIFNYLNNTDNNVFIMGTRTTINENAYKKYLIDMGVDQNKIINQMSPNLAKYIESYGIDDWALNCNLDWLVNRMMQKKKENWDKFAISLNCTHYIYVIDKIKQLFKKNHNIDVDIICPNINMCDVFEQYVIKDRYHSIVNFKICNNFEYNHNGIKRFKRFLTDHKYMEFLKFF